MSMEPLGHISEYGLEKLRTRRNYCVSVSHQPEKEYTIGIVRLSDAEARVKELEATIKQMKADHACEIADVATRFRAVNVERLSEQLGADIFALRDRAEAAEALLKEAIEQRDTWTDNDRAKAWRDVFDSMHQRAMTAEAKLSQLLSYVPEECFEGDDRWELVKCKRSGGAWFGAEDFRAARSIAAKIGGKDE